MSMRDAPAVTPEVRAEAMGRIAAELGVEDWEIGDDAARWSPDLDEQASQKERHDLLATLNQQAHETGEDFFDLLDAYEASHDGDEVEL